MGNAHLMAARKRKYDEYYTSYEDIEREMIHYKPSFKGKRIYCNCDDRSSAFYKYFKDKFHEFGLKALMVTGIKGEKCLFDGVREYVSGLEDGRFQSDECRELLKWCDMVVTNPPFSLWREYFDLVIESGKEFILLGSLACLTLKDTAKRLYKKQFWLGTDKAVQNYWFDVPSKAFMVKRRQIVWLTNIHHDVPKHLELTAHYDPEKYPRYSDYDAIEVGYLKDIPCDYDGKMGVPVTFPMNYNPDEFDILDCVKPHMPDGSTKFQRYIIQKHKP